MPPLFDTTALLHRVLTWPYPPRLSRVKHAYKFERFHWFRFVSQVAAVGPAPSYAVVLTICILHCFLRLYNALRRHKHVHSICNFEHTLWRHSSSPWYQHYFLFISIIYSNFLITVINFWVKKNKNTTHFIKCIVAEYDSILNTSNHGDSEKEYWLAAWLSRSCMAWDVQVVQCSFTRLTLNLKDFSIQGWVFMPWTHCAWNMPTCSVCPSLWNCLPDTREPRVVLLAGVESTVYQFSKCIVLGKP